MSRCHNCLTDPIAPGNRVYCASCSPMASRIWKSRQRQQWNADWRASGQSDTPPYLDGWPSREAYRAYFREYMKRWRLRRKALSKSLHRDNTPTVQNAPSLTSKGGSHGQA